ncbi:MAG TPA: hypothetical protein VJT31_07010 [Rugosimonospora sp.]|nr:hypothetical protein [Rugosimonospora sp.]
MAAARFELYALVRPAGARARTLAGVPVTWRLLSGNNRDLGRAAGTFADVPACLAALNQLREGLAGDPLVSITSPDGRTRWVWRVAVSAIDAAVASRVYQRRVQAEAACAVFLELAADAPVTEVVRLVGSGRTVRL